MEDKYATFLAALAGQADSPTPSTRDEALMKAIIDRNNKLSASIDDSETLNANILVKQDGDDYLLYPSFGDVGDMYVAAYNGWWANTETMRMYFYYHFGITESERKRIIAESCTVKIRSMFGQEGEEGWGYPPEDLNEDNAFWVSTWVDITNNVKDAGRFVFNVSPFNMTNANNKTRYIRCQMCIFDSSGNVERSFYTLVCEAKRVDSTYTCVRHYDSKQVDNCIYDEYYTTGNIYDPYDENPDTVFADLYNGVYQDTYRARYARIPATDIPENKQIRIVALAGTDRYIWSPGVTIDTTGGGGGGGMFIVNAVEGISPTTLDKTYGEIYEAMDDNLVIIRMIGSGYKDVGIVKEINPYDDGGVMKYQMQVDWVPAWQFNPGTADSYPVENTD